MIGGAIDNWCKASRVGAAWSGAVMLLAMVFLLLLPVLAIASGAQPSITSAPLPASTSLPQPANTGTPVAVSDPRLTQLKLLANLVQGNLFGASISVSGNTAVVGAPNPIGKGPGKAYVYVFEDGVWRNKTELTCEDYYTEKTIPAVYATAGDYWNNYWTGSPIPQYRPEIPASCPVHDGFGTSVSVSGDNLIIGDPTGCRGRGSVYIYTRSGSTWTLQKRLDGVRQGEDFEYQDGGFGCSVSASGNTFFVGAQGEDVATPFRNTNSNNTAVHGGAAYVITRLGSTWETKRLAIELATTEDNFGGSVAVSGDTAIIGSRFWDNTKTDGGAAFIYKRGDNGVWMQQSLIIPADVQASDHFGQAVAISGDTALIGSPNDDGMGSAYAYTRSGTSWGLQRKFTASDRSSGDSFGSAVSLSNDTVAVGAPYDDNRTVVDAGAVYYYPRTGTTGGSERKVVASRASTYGNFGYSVGISRATLGAGQSGSQEALIEADVTAYVTDEDTTLTVPASDGVLCNDGWWGARARLVDSSSVHGKLNLATDGSYVYVPEADFNGVATATYRFSDGTVTSNVTTITIVVNPVNDPPVARDDIETLTPDDVLLEYAEDGEGLLANDTDVDGDKLTISFRPEWPKHAGWCGVVPDGSFSYVPRARFIGTDTFTYTITDGHGGSDSARVTFKVGTGEPPVAVSDSELNQFKLFAVDPGIVRDIGWSVAVSGDTAIVGTGDTTATPAVYSYNRSGSIWNLEQRIRPPFVYDTAGFGTAVAASGNTMVIGAAGSGKAYVYTRPSALADWTFQATLSGPAFEEFGSSVAVSGDTIVVGASAANVNGASHAGAAYVYRRSGAVGWWGYPSKLTAATPASQAGFGRSVSCSGDQVIVGAPGAPDPDGRYHSGAAFVFIRNGRTWDSGVQLPVSALPDNAAFGWSVSICGNTAAVGAWGERDYDNDRWGAAYVFTKGSGIWSLQKKLTEEGARSFGNAVSVTEDALVVGAPSRESSGTGAAAYVYNRRGRQWNLRQTLTSSQPDGEFGWAVCASDKTAIVGAPSEDWAGSAYIETGLSPYVTDGEKTMFVPASSGVLVNDATIGLTPALVDTTALHGSIRFLDGGAFAYTPDVGFVGTATATYRVTDGERTSDPATITIVVNPPNHPPIAIDDAATVACGEWLRVRAPGVLANDSDPDGDPLTIWLNEQQRAQFSLDGDGSYVFHAPHSARQVSFTYTLSDGRGGTAVATVRIEVFKDELRR